MLSFDITFALLFSTFSYVTVLLLAVAHAERRKARGDDGAIVGEDSTCRSYAISLLSV